MKIEKLKLKLTHNDGLFINYSDPAKDIAFGLKLLNKLCEL